MDSNYATAVVPKANSYYQGEKATRITRPWILLEGSPVTSMPGTVHPLAHLPPALFGRDYPAS